jgi:hypothetical protein
MTCLSKVVLVAVFAVFTVAAASACSSAIAQTDEELAAGFTAEKPININIYLPDGGTGTCEQINITGDNCSYGEDVTRVASPSFPHRPNHRAVLRRVRAFNRRDSNKSVRASAANSTPLSRASGLGQVRRRNEALRFLRR